MSHFIPKDPWYQVLERKGFIATTGTGKRVRATQAGLDWIRPHK